MKTWIRFEGKSETRTYHAVMEVFGNESEAISNAKKLKSFQIPWFYKQNDEDVVITKVSLAYSIVNGTYYHAETPTEVVSALEEARNQKRFVHIHLGDSQTGKDWHEEYDCQGYISRSTGLVKVPLIVAKNSNSGPALLEHCIVKIVDLKTKKVLYQHPTYHAAEFYILKNEDPLTKNEFPIIVNKNEKLQARFRNPKEAQKYINKVL